MAEYIFSADLVDQLRRNSMHEVLRDLGSSARDAHLLNRPEFRKLIGYLTEVADGRDRREPLTDVVGNPRPVPRLRLLIDSAFQDYGDLTWFRLNKVANQSRLPLKGSFTRMAASIGRLDHDHLAEIITALVSESPDKKLLKMLNQLGGRVPNAGLDLFTKLAYLFRPDLYFLIPKRWGVESGAIKFIGNDLRKYCAVCRSLRTICDEVGFPSDIRATLFDRAIEMDPIHPTLDNSINRSIGGALAWCNVLEPGEGYVPSLAAEQEITVPLEVASLAIRVRRGETRLRNQLIRAYGNECAVSGRCAKDLLEVAYIAPFPAGDVHSPRNTVLLRADLHTMWDLDLIGVDPETLEVTIAHRLRGSYYESFVGAKLATPKEGAQPDPMALRERWNHFQGVEKAATNGRGKKAAGGTAKSVTPQAKVEVLEDLEPRRPGSSGIWRSPAPGSAVAPVEAE